MDYCRIFLSKKTGQFNVGVFGKNGKLMLVSKDFVTKFDAEKQLLKVNRLIQAKVFNPKPKDYRL